MSSFEENREQWSKQTEKKFESLEFKIGDIFGEFAIPAFRVLEVRGDYLIIFNHGEDHPIQMLTKEEFRKQCAYDNSLGYWAKYMGCDNAEAQKIKEAVLID